MVQQHAHCSRVQQQRDQWNKSIWNKFSTHNLMCSILCLEQMRCHLPISFVITTPNSRMISDDSNSLASLKEIEKIPSPVWSQCQQKQSLHLGKGISVCTFPQWQLGTRGNAGRPGTSAGVPVKPEDSCCPAPLHHGLLGTKRVAILVKPTETCDT